MHLGRHYPFMREFWQCEVQFWPGYVPRKVYVQTLAPNGDSWDLLLAGVITDVGIPDSFITGDPLWLYVDTVGGWVVQVQMHKVVLFPKKYSALVRLALPSLHANVISCEVGPEERSFGGWPFNLNSGADPPFFNGNIPSLLIRAATWSEV